MRYNVSSEKEFSLILWFSFGEEKWLGTRLERRGCDYDLRTIDNLVQLFSSLKAM